MRTTIDLPDDPHEYGRQLAHDRRESIGKVTEDLIRRGVTEPRRDANVVIRHGVPVLSVGHPVTAEDVAPLEDD